MRQPARRRDVRPKFLVDPYSAPQGGGDPRPLMSELDAEQYLHPEPRPERDPEMDAELDVEEDE